MDDELIHRIRRVYAAVGAVEEADLDKLKATVIRAKNVTAVFQDFRGGLGDEELSNFAHSLIHNIANLYSHLRKWAVHNGQDKNKVDKAVDRSLALQIIKDLSNNDKHGYPSHNGGHSGKCPKLIEINRVMRLTTKPEAGSAIAMTIGRDGTLKVSGSGSAKAVITSDIVDKDNNKIGDLHEFATKALDAWEQLLKEFNIKS